jgi:hypothetical protein
VSTYSQQSAQRLSTHSQPSTTRNRHPITALEQPADDGWSSPFAGMTDEEKDREAEKMYALFERLERNPILQAGAPTASGAPKPLRQVMADKVAAGEADAWERREAERERLEAEREADMIEEEAMRELAAYRNRMGRR